MSRSGSENSDSDDVFAQQEWDRLRNLYKETERPAKKAPIGRLQFFLSAALVVSLGIIGYATYCMIEHFAIDR